MQIDERRAPRVTCELPARLYGRVSDLYGEVRNVSRTGVRLFVALPGLDGDELRQLARVVEQHLGSRVKVDLNHAKAESPLRKQLRIVRLGQRDAEDGKVELGCDFDEPLTDDEVWRLGVSVPPMRTTVMPSPRAAPPPRRYGAYLTASEGLRTPTMSGTTLGLRERAVVFCADRTPWFTPSSDDVTTLAVELARAYGHDPVLEIVDGHRQLWKGRTRISAVESAASRMRIWAEPQTA